MTTYPPERDDIERRIAQADRIIRECERRGIDPLEVLKRAIEEHDEKRSRRKARH